MTARLVLPFSMGTYGLIDPVTYERPLDHPILVVGSSNAIIKWPIIQWLTDTYGDRFSTGFDGTDYYIDFPSEEDITWFKLKWL